MNPKSYSDRLDGLLPQFLRRHRLLSLVAKCFPDQCLQRFSFDDSEIVSDLRFAEGRQAFITHTFADYGYFALADALLPAGGIHFDVGANFGFHTFGLCRRLAERGCEFHLFEPNSYCVTCHHLSAPLFPAQKFVINHAAIGREAGVAELSFDPDHVGGGFIVDAASMPANSTHEIQQVSQITTDDYCREKQINRIDLAKVDIEGFELDFLAGARETLKAGMISALYIEISEANLARRGGEPQDIYDALKLAGFELTFPHRKADGRYARYRGYNGVIEFTDFSGELAPVQYDLLAIHRESELWASRSVG